MDHLVAAAQLRGPTIRFSHPAYVFGPLDQQAQVRFSSPSLFRAFGARLAHTGLQTTKRTSFTLRPTAPDDDVVEPIMNALGVRLPEVRFEFAAHDDGAVQVAAFREVMVGRAMDGIELMLDYDRKVFWTDQRPEEVWRALTSTAPVSVAIVL